MIDEIKIRPFLCRITEECHAMLKAQSKIEMVSMSALAEIIFRDALRKRQPGSISNKMLIVDDFQQEQIHDAEIARQVDKMVKANDEV
tara:strand:- start:357 stop:620 length:264 start_codon:yes stop_codon:yes gene_type:complete